MTGSALLLLLLASAAASPLLHGGHSTTTLHEANDSTRRQEGWTPGRSDSGTTSLQSGLYTPPRELDPPQGLSSWEDTLWKFILSPSGTYEDGEQQPPVAVGKNGSQVDGFTDDPYFNYRAANLAGDTAAQPNSSREEPKEDGETTREDTTERTIQQPGEANELGPEVGSEQFEESLRGALDEALVELKKVLTGGTDGGEKVDWQAALSRMRVKRSEDESQDEEDLPVRSLNDIVDVFLIIARQSLEDRDLDQVSIPPLERTFSRSLGVGTLRGFFRGDDGWVRRLTTVQRVGPVRLDRGVRPPEGEPWDLRTVSVSTSLGLQELTVGFERYVADMRALPTVSGRLIADIDDNAVLLNISFSKREDDAKGCDVILQDLKIQRLEGMNLKLTGLGPLNWLLSRIATWLTTHSQEKVAAVIEKELVKIANKELQNMPCDADFITAVSML